MGLKLPAREGNEPPLALARELVAYLMAPSLLRDKANLNGKIQVT
jgi:hypothetical protein